MLTDRNLQLQLRATCRAARDAHDSYVSRMRLDTTAEFLPTSTAIEKSVFGILARGCRPREVELALPWTEEQLGARELAFLSALAAADAVTNMYVHGKLTSAVVGAISGVSTKLRRLCIRHVNDASAPPRPDRATAKGSTTWTKTVSVARVLLQLVGPRLKELRLLPDDRVWPFAALDSLSYCTALTSLELLCSWHKDGTEGDDDGDNEDEECPFDQVQLMRTLSTLTSLRSLDLTIEDPPPFSNLQQRAANAGLLLQPLANLTALTRLDLELGCLQHWPYQEGRAAHFVNLEDAWFDLLLEGEVEEAVRLRAPAAAEWRALMSVVRCMPALQHLRAPVQATASDLASLASLTYLRIGDISLDAVAAAGGAGGSNSGSGLPYRVPYKLPPQLRRLETHAPLTARVVSALCGAAFRSAPAVQPAQGAQAGACSSRAFTLWPGVEEAFGSPGDWHLRFSREDVGEHDRLTQEAAADMRQAASAIRCLLAHTVGCGPDGRAYPRSVILTVSTTSITSGGWGGTKPLLPPPADAAPGAGAGVEAGGGATEMHGRNLGSGHVASWLVALLAAVRPSCLWLMGLVLSPRDMWDLARCLEGVEELHLHHCSYHVASLPLLSASPSLEALNLWNSDWQGAQEPGGAVEPSEWFEHEVVEAAFLGLVMAVGGPAVPTGASMGDKGGGVDRCGAAAPAAGRFPPSSRLQRISVRCRGDGFKAKVEAAVAAARQQLSSRGLDGEEVLRVY